MANQELIEQLKRHEGFRKNIYYCSRGRKTIGYGRNLDANPNFNGRPIGQPLSKELAEQILIADIEAAEKKLARAWAAFLKIENNARRDAFVNMAFNLGVDGLLEFKKTLKHAENGDWQKCAEEMFASEWAKQVKKRATELTEQVATGRYK